MRIDRTLVFLLNDVEHIDKTPTYELRIREEEDGYVTLALHYVNHNKPKYMTSVPKADLINALVETIQAKDLTYRFAAKHLNDEGK